ncbi:MAG: hypothetical protein PVF34_05385 [Gammaproteobacteria bacterium]|jgi:cytochrome c-type biogenesis protein CcmH/NrfG
MAAEQKSISAVVKQPYFIALVLIAIAITVIWVSQSPDSGSSGVAADTAGSANQAAAGQSMAPNPAGGAGAPALKPQAPGTDTPKIVANMNEQRKAGSVSAPGLDRLVKGLEEKVAAEPDNINNRLLLAQTYNELGMQDKALVEMRALKEKNPEHGRINLILGSILSRSGDQEEVKESLTLLDKAGEDKTVQQYLVHLYKGEALIRMQDHAGALKHWKAALENMPPADNRRARLEQRISELSTKQGNAEENKASTNS